MLPSRKNLPRAKTVGACSIQPYVGKRTEVLGQTVEDYFTLIAELVPLAPFRFAIGARHRLETFSNCYFATLSDSFFRGEGYMKNAYRSFDLNTAEFDNWLEPATTKMVKHAKSNKNKLWGDFEGSRINRKKKRDARPSSWAK